MFSKIMGGISLAANSVSTFRSQEIILAVLDEVRYSDSGELLRTPFYIEERQNIGVETLVCESMRIETYRTGLQIKAARLMGTQEKLIEEGDALSVRSAQIVKLHSNFIGRFIQEFQCQDEKT